jgi:hypothetical protein
MIGIRLAALQAALDYWYIIIAARSTVATINDTYATCFVVSAYLGLDLRLEVDDLCLAGVALAPCLGLSSLQS